MIYFCSYIENVYDVSGESIIGRAANTNEIVYLPITKEDLIAIAESFILASEDHAWDIKQILNSLIS
ncbi:MAG: hypothetical protein HYU63_06755 [Armatimonadetes bacterium]|nr:hypothetical protein [Armatimonadota bacterium]